MATPKEYIEDKADTPRTVTVRADDVAEALKAVKFVLDEGFVNVKRLRLAYERLRDPPAVQDELAK